MNLSFQTDYTQIHSIARMIKSWGFIYEWVDYHKGVFTFRGVRRSK